ncbi:MAG: PDZ domain-containing protein [Polyangiales bacterium]
MRLVEVFFVLALGCGGQTGMPGSIGVVAVREATGRIVITEVPAGGAGARAGLEVGDEIVAVDGVAVAGMSADDFHRAVRGPVGTRVTIDVRRDGMIHKIAVDRAAMREIKAQKQ